MHQKSCQGIVAIEGLTARPGESLVVVAHDGPIKIEAFERERSPQEVAGQAPASIFLRTGREGVHVGVSRRKLTKKIGVAPELAGDEIVEVEGIGDIGGCRGQHPVAIVDRAGVEDLDQELPIVGSEEPQETRVAAMPLDHIGNSRFGCEVRPRCPHSEPAIVKAESGRVGPTRTGVTVALLQEEFKTVEESRARSSRVPIARSDLLFPRDGQTVQYGRPGEVETLVVGIFRTVVETDRCHAVRIRTPRSCR